MKHSIFIWIFALLFLFSGCNKDNKAVEKNENEKLKVVTTIFPQYDFIREIAEDKMELKMLLRPGSESHSYEPTPQDIILIQNCDVFVRVGGTSDEWVEKILDSIDTSEIRIISLLDLVDILEEEIVEGMQEEHEHKEGEEIEYDEHVWTSPKNAKKIVDSLIDILSELDVNNADSFKSEGDKYIEKLDALDLEFQNVVDNKKRKTLVFGERFPFRYFVDAYNLDYYAAFSGCSTETDASAGTIAFLIDKVKEDEIPVVFYIEFSNEKIADTIVESADAKKLLFHSCHNVTKDDFEKGISYLDLMKMNVINLKEAIQ